MSDLRPATREELLQAISCALRFNRRGKATRRNADFMALAAAEALADVLDQGNFVIMKKPPAVAVDVRGDRKPVPPVDAAPTTLREA